MAMDVLHTGEAQRNATLWGELRTWLRSLRRLLARLVREQAAHGLVARTERLLVLHEAAEALGLDVVHHDAADPYLCGRLDGVLVLAGWSDVREAGEELRLVVRAQQAIPWHLDLAANGTSFWDSLHPFYAAEAIWTLRAGGAGDASVWQHRYSGLAVVALLDEATRRLLRDFLELGAVVRDGEVCYAEPMERPAARSIVWAVRKTAEVAAALSLDRSTIPQRLLGNVRGDSRRVVRRRSLELLLRHFPGTAERCQAIEAALGDAEPGIRLLAAVQLGGPRGFQTVRHILEGSAHPEPVRAAALRHLGRCFPRESVLPFVERILAAERRGEELLRAAVEVAGALRHDGAVAALAAVLGQASTELAQAVVRSLCVLGGEAASAALVGLLGHEEPELRSAAAEALGECGTLGAVEPLLNCARGLFAARELKSAAQIAILKIQSRLTGAEAGRLSVLDGGEPGGSLELVDDGSGALSMS